MCRLFAVLRIFRFSYSATFWPKYCAADAFYPCGFFLTAREGGIGPVSCLLPEARSAVTN